MVHIKLILEIMIHYTGLYKRQPNLKVGHILDQINIFPCREVTVIKWRVLYT